MFTIHLIGWGDVPAKPAGEIKTGDVLTFNYGYEYTVTSVGLCGEKSVKIGMIGNKHGIRTSQRFLKTRLVAAHASTTPAVKMVQGTLREVPSVSDFEQAATAEFKAMLADKVRQAQANGATEEEAIKAVRAIWLQAISESA